MRRHCRLENMQHMSADCLALMVMGCKAEQAISCSQEPHVYEILSNRVWGKLVRNVDDLVKVNGKGWV